MITTVNIYALPFKFKKTRYHREFKFIEAEKQIGKQIKLTITKNRKIDLVRL